MTTKYSGRNGTPWSMRFHSNMIVIFNVNYQSRGGYDKLFLGDNWFLKNMIHVRFHRSTFRNCHSWHGKFLKPKCWGNNTDCLFWKIFTVNSNVESNPNCKFCDFVPSHFQGCNRKRTFFWGGRVIFLDFFPGVKCFFLVENFHFGRPKQNLVVLKSDKQKKRKGPLLIFWLFSFPPSLFFPLFPYLFFPGRSAEISWSEVSGEHSPPPHLLCHWSLPSCSLAFKATSTKFWNLYDIIFLQVGGK